ncbi:MAG: hypothetical protein CMJ83_06930 [Planctomycetes bacterium]|nr:hypothetical protein [Planctomycetota bacterium]
MVMDRERLTTLEQRQEADLVEIFSSVQGEGLRVGELHTFVRFAHCDMHCAYCDTPLCHAPPKTVRIQRVLGGGFDAELPNPIDGGELERVVDGILAENHPRAMSLTGGEPLLHPWTCDRLGAVARARGVPVLLETDGNLPDAFAGIRDVIDIVSLDWKLASATGEPTQTDAHVRMLELARGLETIVKMVFTADTTFDEVRDAAEIVARIDPVTIVLQPCTPFGRVTRAPSVAQGLGFLRRLAGGASPVRLLPQVHRLMDLP